MGKSMTTSAILGIILGVILFTLICTTIILFITTGWIRKDFYDVYPMITKNDIKIKILEQKLNNLK